MPVWDFDATGSRVVWPADLLEGLRGYFSLYFQRAQELETSLIDESAEFVETIVYRFKSDQNLHIQCFRSNDFVTSNSWLQEIPIQRPSEFPFTLHKSAYTFLSRAHRVCSMN